MMFALFLSPFQSKIQDGAEFGYIRFADVNAAQDAYKGMKGFPLGGKNRCIIVDFAK